MSDSSNCSPASTHSDLDHSKSSGSCSSNPIANEAMVNGIGSPHASHSGTNACGSGACEANGSGAESKESDQSSTRINQAEVAVDEFATKVKNAASSIGKSLVWANSRIREAAADFWAEAQNIRSGKQN